MTHKDRLIREVAKELGLSIKKTTEIIKCQDKLFRKTIKNKQPASFYYRGVGTFMHREVVNTLNAIRVANSKAKAENKQQSNNEEDPLEFE